MNMETRLAQRADGTLWLQKGPAPERRVVTVAQACRRLRRSRRQVYRLMKAGALGPPEKMLGERLLEATAVESLSRAPLTAQPLPGRLDPLFPEYKTRVLNAGKDGVLIISRVLESGGREDLRWLLKRYPRRDIQRFVESEACRLLSERSKKLWSLVFRATPGALPAWRRADPWRESRA